MKISRVKSVAKVKGIKNMKIIKPSFEILNMPDGDEIYRHLELAARICYKSEDKITQTSAAQFLKGLVKSGHESVIEHISISVKIVCDRGVSHELIRHRLCSFSQECVVGSTQVHSGSGRRSIKELYDKYEGTTPNGRTHVQTILLRSVDDDNILVNDNKINHVFYKGVQPVSCVITAQGYTSDDVDFWMLYFQKNFFKKRLTVEIGYLLPLDFGTNFTQEQQTQVGAYHEMNATDVSLVKNIFMFGVKFRFNKGHKIRKSEKDIEKVDEKESQGLF